jgi:hypothetical protein
MNTCRANRNVGNKVGIYSQLCFAGGIFGAEMLLGPREGRRRPPSWNHWNAWHGTAQREKSGNCEQKMASSWEVSLQKWPPYYP